MADEKPKVEAPAEKPIVPQGTPAAVTPAQQQAPVKCPHCGHQFNVPAAKK